LFRRVQCVTPAHVEWVCYKCGGSLVTLPNVEVVSL
jgi:hypothetical protein